MKQHEIETGNWYLFARTLHDHRKHLVGSAVKVIGRVKGKVTKRTGGKTPDRFKLKTGDKANASELEPLGPCKLCKKLITKEPLQVHYMRFCSVDCMENYKNVYEFRPH